MCDFLKEIWFLNRSVIYRPLLGETVMEISYCVSVIFTAFQEKKKPDLLCKIIWGLLPTDKSKIVISLVIQLGYRPLTTSSLSGADRLDGVCRLPGVQEGNMGLRAYSIHRPVLPIGQAHILFAVRQLSGQKLAGKRHGNWDCFGFQPAWNSWERLHCFTLHKLFSAFQRWK